MLGRCLFRLLLLFGSASRPPRFGRRPCSFVYLLRSFGFSRPSLRHAHFLANAICRVKEESRTAETPTVARGTRPNPPVTRRPSQVFRCHTPPHAPIARCQPPRRPAGQSTSSPSANTLRRSVVAD